MFCYDLQSIHRNTNRDTQMHYIIEGLRARATVLLQRAARAVGLTTGQRLALTATAYRARARAAQLVADARQAVSDVWGMCNACTEARAYLYMASQFAHGADLRGA